MISLILFLRSDLHGSKVTNRSSWHWINMQEAIVQVILESLEHSVWLCLSLSSIVHITCSLFVITLLSRFSRKTVSCSFLRTRTAWSSRARLSRANDGITGSCSKPFYRRNNTSFSDDEKIRIDFIYSLLRICNDFILSLNYRFLFFRLSVTRLEEEEGSSERASERAHVRWIARKIKASPFGETTTRRL